MFSNKLNKLLLAYGQNMVAELEEESVDPEAVALRPVEAVPVQVEHDRVPLPQSLHLPGESIRFRYNKKCC